MHSFLNLKPGQKAVLAIIATALIVLGFWMFTNREGGGETTIPPRNDNQVEFTIDERPTDFVKVGNLTYNNPGQGQNTLYLVYEEPGKPALTKEIKMDGLSVCAAENGALPCVAMSVSFDVAFGGKRAIVEGIMQGDDAVLLRKLSVVPEGQEPRLGEPGDVFISWPHAVSLIQSCNVSQIFQSHALDVYLTIKENDLRVRAVEPMIDEVFTIFEQVRETCPLIPIATE